MSATSNKETENPILHLLFSFGVFLLVLNLLFSAVNNNQQLAEFFRKWTLRGILVLLIFSNQILHIGLGLCEFHLVHTLLCIPMQESFPLEHGSELVTDTLEQLLNRSRVTQERNSHLQATRRDVTLRSENVVRNPLNEVGRVLVLNVLHLLFNFLHRNFATENSSDLSKK